MRARCVTQASSLQVARPLASHDAGRRRAEAALWRAARAGSVIPCTRDACVTPRPNSYGFTLVELILVMALLLIVLGTAAPSLSNFFRGRHLDSEARRFLSLTRYAQSRAVSESLPMMVWIDPDQGIYGLTALGGYTGGVDTNAVQFTLKAPLTVEVYQSSLAGAPAMSGASGLAQASAVSMAAADPWSQTQSARAFERLAQLRFLPDGFIGESSPDVVVFREEDRPPVWLARNANRMHYEIQTNAFSLVR